MQEARNSGIARATGEYITFVDSDDYLQTDAYEVAYNSAKKDNVDILKFNHRTFTDGKDDHDMGTNDYSSWQIMDRDSYLYSNHPTYVWERLFKAELIKKDGVKFIKGIAPCDDICFDYMVHGRAKNIKIIPTKLYNYRLRGGSIVNSISSQDEWFVKNYKMIKYTCDDWRKFGYSINHEHILLHRWVTWLFYREKSALKRAKEVLSLFGADIYNPQVISKCSDSIKAKIKKLEDAAAHPEKYQDQPAPAPSQVISPKAPIQNPKPDPMQPSAPVKPAPATRRAKPAAKMHVRKVHRAKRVVKKGVHKKKVARKSKAAVKRTAKKPTPTNKKVTHRKTVATKH